MPTESVNISNNDYPRDRPADPLVALIKSIYPISDGAEAYAQKHATITTIAKGAHLVKSGEHCDRLYFVEKGVLRGYVRQENKDITTWITGEKELVTSISSYYQHIPSIETIEAIEDCKLIALHRDDMTYLYEHYPEINVVVRIILEKYYQDAEERAYICRLTDATAKYHRFINTKSQLLNRIPLKYIASYLGMTLETLSRIRSKLSHQR